MRKRSARSAAAALLFACSLLLLAGCGSEPSGGGGGGEAMSYKDMKTMVVDILKTEDAQKALEEGATKGTLGQGTGLQAQMLTTQGQEQVRLAVKDVLVSPDYYKVIEKLMTDERFAGEFAKAVNTQNKQVHKDLMKDPGYQQDLVSVFKTPEMDQVILDVMQTPQYRKHIQTIMQETMQSPLVRIELLDLMKKAVQEELKPKPFEPLQKEGEQGGGGSGGESEGGGSGGGEGGGGSS
ncbi:spore germination lipoprotein GerD [Paenibacillus tarimensis]|uniref:spore germination lipoprotein GerD n=1 Tax=Paenibacillus tarimensis TaxID=416012 RepID=UPI001F287D18|nr:spore germination lipoprotein GerD [Paenibacillus tarimensis]MCF2946100.1 spore gernimation protein [Paenibacillus tarimensis]